MSVAHLVTIGFSNLWFQTIGQSPASLQTNSDSLGRLMACDPCTTSSAKYHPSHIKNACAKFKKKVTEIKPNGNMQINPLSSYITAPKPVHAIQRHLWLPLSSVDCPNLTKFSKENIFNLHCIPCTILQPDILSFTIANSMARRANALNIQWLPFASFCHKAVMQSNS